MEASEQVNRVPPLDESGRSEVRVWVLAISHRHGMNFSVHQTEAEAKDEALAYVEEWWPKEFRNLTMPSDPDAAVAEYFERMESEWCQIESCPLTLPLTVAALDHMRKAVAHMADAFDKDEPVNGADLVEWFANWRNEAKVIVNAAGGAQ